MQIESGDLMAETDLRLRNLLNILDAQGKDEDILFQMRELNQQHAPFDIEKAIWLAIYNGQPEALLSLLHQASRSPDAHTYGMGLLSKNPLRHCQYMAVTSAAVSCRTAMAAGVPESQAYALSDSFIQKIDCMDDPEKVVQEAFQIQIQFARLVAKHKQKAAYSKPIRTVIDYISHHLHESLAIETLAAKTPYSPKYLAILFKKETGQTLTDFILVSRIQEAKRLLKQNHTCKEVAYLLGFCSQSHFIQRFEKITGVTPKEYVKGN